MIDWAQFVVEGGARPDAITGLNGGFRDSLGMLIASAPPEIQKSLRIGSAFRSKERQAELWEQALKKYGSPEAARKWVAPPGNSKHNHGDAADLKYLSPEAQAWVHANAPKYGLAFPMAHEPWHIERAGARGSTSGQYTPTAASGGPSGSPNAILGMGYEPDTQNALAAPHETPQMRLQTNALDPRAFQVAAQKRNYLSSM